MRLLLALAILLFLLAFLLLYFERDEGPFRVVDGDTAWGEVKYRAKYIDAPELGRQKDWHLSLVGNESCLRWAAERAREEVEDRLNYVLYKPWEKDPYGRQLAYFNGGKLEMGLVANGLAFCYYRNVGPLDALLDPFKAECLQQERYARSARLGLWSCATPRGK